MYVCMYVCMHVCMYYVRMYNTNVNDHITETTPELTCESLEVERLAEKYKLPFWDVIQKHFQLLHDGCNHWSGFLVSVQIVA